MLMEPQDLTRLWLRGLGTPCSILQHTAAYLNILQHTTAYCSIPKRILQHTLKKSLFCMNPFQKRKLQIVCGIPYLTYTVSLSFITLVENFLGHTYKDPMILVHFIVLQVSGILLMPRNPLDSHWNKPELPGSLGMLILYRSVS